MLCHISFVLLSCTQAKGLLGHFDGLWQLERASKNFRRYL
jgi:hypothetical protein